eukprot:s369_g18.t1
MAPAVPLDFAFADPEDAMGDWEQVDPPEVSTPEHWSDVGLLSARTGLLEQQLQATQAQLSQMAAQLATVAQLSHNLQHLEMQLVLQRQQHQEDMVKMMAAQAVSLSNLTPSTRTKARPGPRERQKLREERRAQEAGESLLQVGSSSASTLEPDLSTLEASEPSLAAAPESEAPSQPGSAAEAQEPPEVASQPAAAVATEATELTEVTKTSPARSSQRWSGVSWCAVILAWGLYLAGDMWSPFTWGMIDDGQVADTTTDEDLAGSRYLAQNAASRLRELGHLQLSVSDCHGAAKLFARAEVLLGNNSAPVAQLVELRRERGFALVCAQHFSEGAALLREALLESMQTSSPIHLPMLAEDQLEEPVDGPVHLMNALSFAYFYLGEFSRAKSVLERAVTLHFGCYYRGL